MNNKIKSILRTIKNRNNSQFVQRVLEINHNDFVLDVSHNGDENKGIPFYHIYIEESGNGFFAEFRKLLNALYFADICGLVPVIEYSRDFSYAEKEEFLDTFNPYEYYFKQPTQYGLDVIKKSACVLNYWIENHNVAEKLKMNNGYEITDFYLQQMAYLVKKYISPNLYIQEKLSKDMQEMITEQKILGVHVRGTDFKQEFNRHPNFVAANEFLDVSKKVFEKGKYDKLFLATDDFSAVNLFQEYYGDRLIVYNDVIRSDGKESVMLSKSKREHHKFLLGYEVLRDMYSLAFCDGLVAGLSQVSICARIVKKSQDTDYKDLEIIDKGIAVNRRRCINDIEKSRNRRK